MAEQTGGAGMSSRADTIRRYIELYPTSGSPRTAEAVAAVDAWEAETKELVETARDRIDGLEAEIGLYEAEVQRLRHELDAFAAFSPKGVALLAEAQRLRDALERIAAAISPNSVYMQKIWLIADAALVEEADRG